MNVRLPGGFIVLLITLAFGVSSVWSQDAIQPAAQETAHPGMSQETVQSSTQAATPSGVQLAEAVVCQDVIDRAPVGSGDVFAKEVPKVYCFTCVVGAEGTQLTHNWYYQGSLKASVKLNVRSSNYRTWSCKTMRPERTGEWMVEILSADGKPLESIIFFLQ
jgi:hypothetical protein